MMTTLRGVPRFAAIAVCSALLGACGTSAETATSEDDAGAGEEAVDTPSEETDGAETDDPPASDPIRIGSVNSLTGPIPFPEASQAARAYFDRLNESGGIAGRTVEYIVEDDAGDQTTAAAAARKLVEDDGVALLAGSASLLECTVNAGLYAEQGVYSMPGVGVDPVCFSSSNIAPVNTGPYLAIPVALLYASEDLGHERICYVQAETGFGRDLYEAQVQRWTEVTGEELVAFDFFTIGDDLTPLVAQSIDNGCDAVLHVGLDSTVIPWMQAVEGQAAEFDTVTLSSGYTREVAEQVGSSGPALYANSEFEPFTATDSRVLADWMGLMDEAGVALTSFAQGGYLAASFAEEVLRDVDGVAELSGPDLRTAVGERLREMEPIESEMIGTGYVVGTEDAHNPNRSSKFVQVVDGEWVVTTDEFVVLPESS